MGALEGPGQKMIMTRLHLSPLLWQCYGHRTERSGGEHPGRSRGLCCCPSQTGIPDGHRTEGTGAKVFAGLGGSRVAWGGVEGEHRQPSWGCAFDTGRARTRGGLGRRGLGGDAELRQHHRLDTCP